MTVKSLVTGIAAAAVVAAAASGVTSTAAAAPMAITPVVFGAPMPLTPAPDLQPPLLQTLNGLAAPGSFAGKATFIQGGLGRIETITADRAFSRKAAQGYFPLTFAVNDIDQNDGVATANVTATSAIGTGATEPVTFVAGPSPTGWQISKDSALTLLSAAS